MQRYPYRAAMAAALLFSNASAAAEEKLPVGRLEFESLSYGLLVGYRKGDGTLTYDGHSYLFSIQGFTGLALGVSKVHALGVVYDLKEVADFAGTYTAIGGDFTLVQGGGSALLRNGRKVVIELQTLHQGAELALGGGSFTITLQEPIPAPQPDPASQGVEQPPGQRPWPYLTIPAR